jgi:hypothetical protein
LLLVFIKCPRAISFDSEAYRYGVLDAIVFPKVGAREPQPGTYTLAGGLGGSGSLASYMSHGTIQLLPSRRYRMGDAEAIGFDVNRRGSSNETGRYVVDGGDLILFSDRMPNWPAHDEMHQVPRRIQIQ